MNKYEEIKNMSEEDFKRLTGIKKATFIKMVEVVSNHEKERKQVLGRPLKLSYEEQILMMLEYIREYRTYYHIATAYKISEANCYKLIKKIEDILVKSEYLRLPSRKKLFQQNEDIKLIVIDATETPIQRPKKNRNSIIQARRNIIQ